MPTHNNLEQSILDMYTDIHLGSCYECSICNEKNEKLSKPVSCWFVGDRFHLQTKRILFIGKNARGFQEYKDENKFIEAFDDGRKLWRNRKNWAYWSYTAEITSRIFGDDSPEYISFTNFVKCNNSDGNDTTSKNMKENCIIKKKVLANEITVIKPTHVIFYTHTDYDNYMPKVFDAFRKEVDEKKKIGKRNMPWLEAEAELDDLKINVLRIGHPQCKKKVDFINSVCDWISRN